MLELFTIRVSDFDTAWLLEYFVVDFANWSEISSDHFAWVIISLVKYVTLESLGSNSPAQLHHQAYPNLPRGSSVSPDSPPVKPHPHLAS